MSNARRLVLVVAVLVAAGCVAEPVTMSAKALRMTYGGDQAMYERLLRETDCDKLTRVAEGRSPEYPRTGDATDLGIDRAVRQQQRANGCEAPAS